MLIYRATSLSSSMPAPAEMLSGRRYRTSLPTKSQIQNAYRQIVREQMVNKERSAENNITSARDIPPPPMQQEVYIQVDFKQSQWTLATITQTPTATQPGSYVVKTQG